MHQLMGLDSSMLYRETARAPTHIAPLSIYDQSTAPGGSVRFKDILAHLEGRLHLAPAFRRKLARVPFGLDHPYWVDDDKFDLEFHVRHIALPKPGDWRQLCIQLARLHSRRLDLTRPPWEIYVVEGLDRIGSVPAGSFAMLYKIHHAAVDGVAGAEIFSAVHDRSAESGGGLAILPWDPEPAPSQLAMLTRSAVNSLRRPTRVVGLARETAPQIVKLARDGLVAAARGRVSVPRAAPPTRFGAAVGPHRVFDGRSYPLVDLKHIRSAAPGSTLNDVGLAIVSGSLRRYLTAKGELPRQSMAAQMPISIRVPGSSAANQITLVAVSLASDIDDPVERLAHIRDQTRLTKDASGIPARALVEVSESLPGALLGLGLRAAAVTGFDRAVARTANTMLTNVPGPQVPLYLAGAISIAQSGLPPIGNGMGLVHGMGSYVGTINISFVSDRDMMPDPGFYADCIEESVDELRAAAGAMP